MKDITPDYKFFTSYEDARDYFVELARNTGRMLGPFAEYLKPGSNRRTPTFYDPDALKTYMFLYQKPALLHIFGFLYKLNIKRKMHITGWLDNILTRTYVYLFDHEYLHQIITEVTDDEVERELLVKLQFENRTEFNRFIDDLLEISNYEGPFTESFLELESVQNPE